MWLGNMYLDSKVFGYTCKGDHSAGICLPPLIESVWRKKKIIFCFINQGHNNS